MPLPMHRHLVRNTIIERGDTHSDKVDARAGRPIGEYAIARRAERQQKMAASLHRLYFKPRDPSLLNRRAAQAVVAQFRERPNLAAAMVLGQARHQDRL